MRRAATGSTRPTWKAPIARGRASITRSSIAIFSLAQTDIDYINLAHRGGKPRPEKQSDLTVPIRRSMF
jgi:hypothetical protein